MVQISKEAQEGSWMCLGRGWDGDDMQRVDPWLTERPLRIRNQSGLREGGEKVDKLYYHFTKVVLSGSMAFSTAD